MSDLPQISLRAAASISGSPQNPTLVQLLQTASRGGDATFDFFSGEARARKQLADLAAQGPGVFTLVDDAGSLGLPYLGAGMPAYVATSPTGRLILQTQLSAEVMQADSSDYAEAGIATMWMVTDEGPIDVFTSTVEKLGPGVAGAALMPAMMSVLGALRTFITTFFSQVSAAAEAGGGDAATVAGDAAEAAADEAAVDGEVVADELVLSVEFGPLAVVGLAVAALSIVLMILAFGLSKTMTAWIRIFNLTPQPMQLRIAHNYNLKIRQQPTDGLLPPPGPPPAPPGVTPVTNVIFRADYVLQNDNTWDGLGVVIQAPQQGPAPGLTFMIDIPSAGDNSMAVVPSGAVDPNEFYDQMSGQITELCTQNGGPYTITAGTNQLRGQSSDPLGGDDGYNYEYVVLAEGGGLMATEIGR